MKILFSLLIAIFAVSCHAFLEENLSCADRCGAEYNRGKPCQCNTKCTKYKNCCSDYNTACMGKTDHAQGSGNNCKTLSGVVEELWDNDVNRMAASDFSINWQQHIPDRTTTDHANERFFSHVNEARFSGPTYRTFLALLDNYNPTKGQLEKVTSQEQGEDDAFLDEILKTSVIGSLQNYLICTRKIASQAELKQLLKRVWFGLFSRSSSLNVDDTSGFEHVFIGEYKNAYTVNGFHNWISFYKQEKIGHLNYYGYVSREMIENNFGVVGLAFNWNGHLKTKGSFLVGVSPEFDMALYTLCYIQKSCSFTLKSKQFSIKTFNVAGHLSTAFIS